MSIENSQRKPSEDWLAIVYKAGTKKFAAAFAPNPVLDTSVMKGPCVGVEAIASFSLPLPAACTTHSLFANETNNGAKTYLSGKAKPSARRSAERQS
jgi:hypothetical protein